MINKKILSGILSGMFLFSALSVSAKTFSDVENDPKVEWAKPYIEAMAEEGYLKGYEDGTFKPNKTISKTEALIILARMIGVNNEEFADSVEYAEEEFGAMLKKYGTNYTKEMAFLLYNGVLSTDELDTYIGKSVKNEPLMRYEAAILMTKLLGAEEDVQSNLFVSSTYADTTEIPDSARVYVEFVKDEGIMQGMGNNEKGQPIFAPLEPVTRAQMSKMLCSLIDVLDLSVQTGVIAAVDTFEGTVTITIDGSDIVHELASSSKMKINGRDVAIEDFERGMHVKVTHLAGQVALIENNVVIEDAVIYGLVSGTKDSSGTKAVTIADANDKAKVATYVLADDATIRVNGAIDLFSKVKKNSYVSLTIVEGEVAVLEVIDKSTTATGTLLSVEANGETTLLSVESPSGERGKYETSLEGVVVSRNNLDSSLGQLMVGDSIVLKMTYGKITKISASSKKQSIAGSIESITHTTNGSVLVVKQSGNTREFPINKKATILINSSEKGTVYDLRPGTDIEADLESNEIIAIEAASAVAKSQLSGIVKTINAEYSLMIIEEDGKEISVYVKSNTKIVDSLTGKEPTFKSIEKGRTATITGSNASGVFEASVIVLQ